jgi:multidrug efflux pump
MRRSLGTAVFSGMIGVTLFGIFLTPVFFFVIQGIGDQPIITTDRWRRIASCAAGGLLGLGFGFLLAGIGIGSWPWTPIVAACAGALIVPVVDGIHQAVRFKG